MTRTATAPSGKDKDQIAVLVRASDLLQAGGAVNVKQAARLLDAMPNAPLFVQDGGNTNSIGNTPFSSTLLTMKLGRQMDEAATASAAASSSPSQRADALQWTYRCRKLADAVLGVEKPSLDALKVAHYMDTIACRREVALYQSWGNSAGVQAATRQRDALRRVWNEQILPILAGNAPTLENNGRGGETTGSVADKEAEWAARVSLMVALYQKDRPVISEA